MEWRWASGPPVSKNQIANIQRALGVALPESLLNIVRTGDGLRPDRRLIVDSRTDGEHVLDGLAAILRFGDESILRSHESMMEDAENRYRDPGRLRWVIPIAHNG